MKVLQLGPYPPPHGGVQTNMVAILQYLGARGVPCAAMNLTRHRRQNDDTVLYPKSALGVLRLLYQLDYDIAHLHVGGNFSLRLLGLAIVCSLIPGRKVILTLHSGGYPSSPAGKRLLRSRLARAALRRIDRIIAVNFEIKDFFEKSGFPSARIRLIRPDPPVELSAATGLTPELAEFFQAHHPVLLSVGGMEPEYNIPTQIGALGQLLRTFSRAGLVVIGGGSMEESLRTSLQTCSYAGDVLLCGDVPHDVTLHAIKEAAVLLRTTSYDGDSIAIREALKLQTPVIATDNGMRPQGVKLIPEAKVESLAQAIDECLRYSNPIGMSEVRSDNNLREIVNLYAEVLSTRTSEASGSLPFDAREYLPMHIGKDS